MATTGRRLHGTHETQFVLGAGAGETNPAAFGLQLVVVHFLDLGSGGVGFAISDPKQFGDTCSGNRMVASNHGHADAAFVAFFDGGDGFFARRVNDADQPEQHELAGETLRIEGGVLNLSLREPRRASTR